jgi:hypothetical protein
MHFNYVYHLLNSYKACLGETNLEMSEFIIVTYWLVSAWDTPNILLKYVLKCVWKVFYFLSL